MTNDIVILRGNMVDDTHRKAVLDALVSISIPEQLLTELATAYTKKATMAYGNDLTLTANVSAYTATSLDEIVKELQRRIF
jgi:hypothetical protein